MLPNKPTNDEVMNIIHCLIGQDVDGHKLALRDGHHYIIERGNDVFYANTTQGHSVFVHPRRKTEGKTYKQNRVLHNVTGTHRYSLFTAGCIVGRLMEAWDGYEIIPGTNTIKITGTKPQYIGEEDVVNALSGDFLDSRVLDLGIHDLESVKSEDPPTTRYYLTNPSGEEPELLLDMETGTMTCNGETEMWLDTGKEEVAPVLDYHTESPEWDEESWVASYEMATGNVKVVDISPM